MRKNKKLILISNILATTTILALPTISIVNNINTVNDSNTQFNNVVQNNQEVEMNSIDSDIDTIESNDQLKAVGDTFTVDAATLMATGWATNITDSLVFTVLNDSAKTVSVKAENAASFIAGNFNIQSTITNAGTTYNITEIVVNAFQFCFGLTGTLTIPASVTSIGDNAFAYCIGLTGTLTISASVTSIGNSAFVFCNFVLIDVDSSNTTFSKATNLGPDCQVIINDTKGIFDNNSKTVGSLCYGKLILPSTLTSISDSAFGGSFGLTSLDLSNATNLLTIGDNAFAYCTGLTGTLTIPASVTSIGDHTFRDCYGLTSLDLSNATSLKTIGDITFFNCSNLTGTLTIPASVTSIGEAAFNSCFGLTGTLIIPASVTYIGDEAFNGLDSKDFKFLSETPPAILGTGIFEINDSTITIYVPKVAKAAWDATPEILTKLGIASYDQIKTFTTPDPQPLSDFPWWAYLVIIGATTILISVLTITIIAIKKK